MGEQGKEGEVSESRGGVRLRRPVRGQSVLVAECVEDL
jgi:hypothetical protein